MSFPCSILHHLEKIEMFWDGDGFQGNSWRRERQGERIHVSCVVHQVHWFSLVMSSLHHSANHSRRNPGLVFIIWCVHRQNLLNLKSEQKRTFGECKWTGLIVPFLVIHWLQTNILNTAPWAKKPWNWKTTEFFASTFSKNDHDNKPFPVKSWCY